MDEQKKRKFPRRCACGKPKDDAGNCVAGCLPRPHRRIQEEQRRLAERARRARIAYEAG